MFLYVKRKYLFLSKSKRISPLKLQKLIYFSHGWHLAFEDKPLIDELVQAWQFGPVIESIYHEFKEYGSGNINKFATIYDPDSKRFVKAMMESNDTSTKEILNEIWIAYGKRTAIQLSNATHLPGTPWYQTYRIIGANVIDNDLIKKYFKSKLEESN